MALPNESVERDLKWWAYILLFLGFGCMWFGAIYGIRHFFPKNEFGDALSGGEGFFSALTMMGVVVSIFLQRNELKLQRHELRLQREALEAQREELNASVLAQRDSGAALKQRLDLELKFFQDRLSIDLVKSFQESGYGDELRRLMHDSKNNWTEMALEESHSGSRIRLMRREETTPDHVQYMGEMSGDLIKHWIPQFCWLSSSDRLCTELVCQLLSNDLDVIQQFFELLRTNYSYLDSKLKHFFDTYNEAAMRFLLSQSNRPG